MSISFSLFAVGLIGFIINRRHVLLALLSIEIMLLAVTLLFLLQSHWTEDISGLIVGIYAIVIAGAESAIGLALVVSYHRNIGQIYLS
jgi:NADH-ubiquinone oxidoreductase chain 4L